MKSPMDVTAPQYDVSLPAWGAWIEIEKAFRKAVRGKVAPRMGSVD